MSNKGPKSRHEGMFQPNQSGNPNGRPKGSKNKNKLPRPERMLLNAADGCIQELIALAKNDTDKLSRKSEVPASVQLQAINRVLELVEEIKNKLALLDDEDEVETPESKVAQLFSTKAK